jgi:hypothetical protein
MRKIHELKIAPEHFKAVQPEEKRAEFRINDRDYACGDVLRLHEWEPESG